MSPEELDLPAAAVDAIEALSHAERLLVASDFDGTMSPIVAVPADARTVPETQAAMTELARLPHTSIAVVSGRSLEMLHRLTALPSNAHLVGSHGVEFDSDFAAGLRPAEKERLAEIARQAHDIAAHRPGVEVEMKPASVALHYRHVPQVDQPAVVAQIKAGPCAVSGVHVTTGKMVVEIAAIATGKGVALERLRTQEGATSVVFLGDDVTDEHAFERLGAGDVGVKVGEGDTVATVRIPDTDAVARFLTELAARRRRFLGGPHSA